MQVRRTAAALTATAALSLSGVAAATPAQAQPIFAGGLVNVNVQDVNLVLLNDVDVAILNGVLNDNVVNVGVVAQVAAVVCDVNVGGILGELEDNGTATCDAANNAGEIVFTAVG